MTYINSNVFESTFYFFAYTCYHKKNKKRSQANSRDTAKLQQHGFEQTKHEPIKAGLK